MRWSELWRLDYSGHGFIAPGPWLWLRVVSWAVLLFGVTTLAFFSSLMMPDWFGLPEGSDYACAIVIPALGLIFYVLAVRFAERRAVSELEARYGPSELLFGFAIGFAFISTILLLLWLFGLYDIQLGHWRHWYNYFIFNAYVSAVLEEVAFRAVLLRLLARLIGPAGGLIVSTVLFAAAHAGHASFPAVVQIAVAGLFLGSLYLVSGRLWLSIGAHLGYDFTEWSIMGVGDKNGALVVTPAPHASALLTGGSFGPDGSVLTTVVGALFIGAIIAARVSRKTSRSR